MNSVTVMVNGTPAEFARGTTVAEIVSETTTLTAGVAVALNDEVVSRHQWATTEVRDRDRLELLTAAQGG